MENSNSGNRTVGIMEVEKQREIEMERQEYEEVDNQDQTDHVSLKKKDNKNIKIQKLIYYILGVLEALLAFRFVFKILGANSESAFVSMIYSASNIFLKPFTGIFRKAVTEGIETESVLEPPLIIAMIVYALLAWGIVKLIEISSESKDS